MSKQIANPSDGQILLDGFHKDTPAASESPKKQVSVSATFKELHPQENADTDLSQSNFPDEIKKNRSELMSTIVNISPDELSEFEQMEHSELTYLPVQTKVQVSYEKSEELDIKITGKLTNFDREVIDAVSTLTPHMQYISASTIFRVITGKGPDYAVTPQQRKKIDEAMLRCSRCLIQIDLTKEFLSQNPSEVGNTKALSFKEQLINYRSIVHKANNGTNIYYALDRMPSIFTYAELLGKVSEFPLSLLDTPVSKTETLISVQSFLLRTIDEEKKKNMSKMYIPWSDIYVAAEIDYSVRQYTAKIRKNALKMLDFWIEKGYILNYISTTLKDGKLEIFLTDI